MSRISVSFGDASVDLAASVDLGHVSGRKTVGYTPRDLLAATEQALRAVGTAESHAWANAVYEIANPTEGSR